MHSQIGACRHGDRCSRKHIRPPFSQTILLPNVYHNPAHDPVCKLSDKELQEGFDAVYEDLYCELAKFGHLLELHVSCLLAENAKVVLVLICTLSRSVTMLATISSAMYTLDTNGKLKHKLLSKILMIAGMQVRFIRWSPSTLSYICTQVDLFTPNFPRWQIFVKRAAAKMRTANAIAVVFATSCISAWHPKNS